MINEEIWITCLVNDNYEVSNLGNVRSKDKQVNGKAGSKPIKRGKLLSPTMCNGYYGVSLSVTNNRPLRGLIHRLVAIAFIENPENKPCINHIDGNKLNNNVENLEWITYSDNMYHASKLNLTKTGEKHYNSKLSDNDIIEIRNKYLTGNYSHSILGKEYNVSKQNITSILNNKSRKL